jgi:hypothetical protein
VPSFFYLCVLNCGRSFIHFISRLISSMIFWANQFLSKYIYFFSVIIFGRDINRAAWNLFVLANILSASEKFISDCPSSRQHPEPLSRSLDDLILLSGREIGHATG